LMKKFFIIPQRWITPAIAAAAMHFGPIDSHVSVKYFNLQGQSVADPPGTIWIDKRKTWDKRQIQCILVHEYGHLKKGPKHKPGTMRAKFITYEFCTQWLERHHVR
jgi:hypothetical protein